MPALPVLGQGQPGGLLGPSGAWAGVMPTQCLTHLFAASLSGFPSSVRGDQGPIVQGRRMQHCQGGFRVPPGGTASLTAEAPGAPPTLLQPRDPHISLSSGTWSSPPWGVNY